MRGDAGGRVEWSDAAAIRLASLPAVIGHRVLDESERLWQREPNDRPATFPHPPGGMTRLLLIEPSIDGVGYAITFFYRYSQDETTIHIFALGVVRHGST